MLDKEKYMTYSIFIGIHSFYVKHFLSFQYCIKYVKSKTVVHVPVLQKEKQ